jgi:CRP/FNR family cyclic AMP-dependent transcriptional regulator
MKQFLPFSDPESVEAILSRISFLGGMTKEQRQILYSYLETISYEEGEFIARRGEEPTHIYIINSGSIHLMIEDEKSAVVKRTFISGDCFGEAAMLTLVNNSASFIAAEDCTLIVFSRKAFNRLRKEDPTVFSQLILNLARGLARKLQYSDDILLHPKK